MAEAVVFQLLSNFAPYLQGEVNLLTGVREEIEYIRDEFESMSAFLRVADSMEERHQELKVWVKQVREAAYDTADALDMYMLRLGHRHGDGFRGFLRKVSCFVKTLKARHQIASEVKRIKSKVDNISQRHQRYSDMYGRVLEQGTRSPVSNNVWHDGRGDALLLQEADLVGIDKPKSQLIQWLVDEDPRLKVLSVAGMGGMGKTTLTKKVYDDAGVKSNFQNHAWITVSESFKIEQLLKEMIRQLFEEVKQPLPHGVDNMDTNSLKGIINAFLQQKRYVLVFDDVWDTNAWHSCRYAFPDGNCGSRVIITTRNVDLASSATNEYHGSVYNLQPLPSDESWTLFCRKTFWGSPCPSDLEALAKDILKRCQGLPLAIVAISGLLSIKEKSIGEWERIYRSLGAELERNEDLQSMNRILSISYFDLPYYLKLCFLYLSIFPEDFIIDHWLLVRLWVAERFVEAKEGMTAEEVAEGYLKELRSRSLIQVAELRADGRVKGYRIHDLWREILVSKFREQNIASISSNRGRSWTEKVRRLAVHQDLENIEQSNCFTRLRSLLVFSGADSLSTLSKIASAGSGLKLLTVLDLRETQLETFPNEIVKLVHLTYLSLRGTKVKEIPKSIGKLKNLETLDLKQTLVTELPDEILNLKRLSHLLLYRYEEGTVYWSFYSHIGFKSPVKIGCLPSLQKLCSIEANHGSSDLLLKEVGKLTRLRRLKILRLRREDGNVLCLSLEKLQHLNSLVVGATEEDEIIDLDSLSSPPRLLQKLSLGGRLQKLPHWIPSLHNLVSVILGWSKLRDADSLQSLQGLPNLVRLRLVQAYEGERLCFKAGGFQRLKYLVLGDLEGLRWVRVEAGSMPLLEILGFFNCKLMMELPSGVENLTNLQLLDLSDMSDSLISSLSRDYWKISHIPDVEIWNTKEGYWKRERGTQSEREF